MTSCGCACHGFAQDLVMGMLLRQDTAEVLVECFGCDCSGVVDVTEPEGRRGQGPAERDARGAPPGASFFRRPEG